MDTQLSVRDPCQGSGNVWLQKIKTSNFLLWTHCAEQKRVGETWAEKVRKMMGMLNVGCRSCCGSDLFVVRFLKLFFPRLTGDGSGSWLSVFRCSTMRDSSNTLSPCHRMWLYAAMMILSCFSIVCSFLDLGVRIVSNFILCFDRRRLLCTVSHHRQRRRTEPFGAFSLMKTDTLGEVRFSCFFFHSARLSQLFFSLRTLLYKTSSIVGVR